MIATVKARSDVAYRRLIAQFVRFYFESLFNRHWGEQASVDPGNTLRIAMVFQGLSQQQASDLWHPFFAWVAASPQDFALSSPPIIVALPARQFWEPATLQKLPGVVIADDRPGAPAGNVFWAGNLGETGQFLHGYQSVWLPASLLRADRQHRLGDALFASSRHWKMSLHFNKGLAGATPEEVTAARDTAMNPAVLSAFALAITAGTGPPAFPNVIGHEPDLVAARREAGNIDKAMRAMLPLVARRGSYVSEGNYFDGDWQQSCWGTNYARLRAVKKRYDPDGLFFVHHGVGAKNGVPTDSREAGDKRTHSQDDASRRLNATPAAKASRHKKTRISREEVAVVGIVGIAVSLGLLIFPACRGWNVIMIAPVCAGVVLLFSWGEAPLLATYTQTFMPALGTYLAKFFPLFMLGAIFGKLMDDSGCARDVPAAEGRAHRRRGAQVAERPRLDQLRPGSNFHFRGPGIE